MDGTFPLASNKWQLLEYEFAYDPAIENRSSNDIILNWYTNFHGVTDVSLHGELNGEINGSIGSGSSSGSNFFSSLGTTGKSVGTVALSALGVDFITENTINAATGENELNLPKDIFKAMSKGVSSALSSSAAKLPGNIINVFSAILGSTSSGQAVKLKFNADIEIDGDMTNHGSFPSSPTGVYVPGTIIQSGAAGYIPNYDKPLGVFNLTSMPKIKVHIIDEITRVGSPREGFTIKKTRKRQITKLDNSSKLVINSDLLNDATVNLIEEDVIFIKHEEGSMVSSFNGTLEAIGRYDEVYTNCTSIKTNGIGNMIPAVRMTIEVVPNNGQPSVYIVHTFLAELEVTQ